MATTTGNDTSKVPNAFKRKGIRVFGLGKAEFIKYFFGGNASLAIVVLILICVFLMIEAAGFLPGNRRGLEDYRKSGQEFVDFIRDEINQHTATTTKLSIAYYAEVNETSRHEDQLVGAFIQVRNAVQNDSGKVYEGLEQVIDRVDELKDDLEEAREEAAEAAEAASANAPADPNAVAANSPAAPESDEIKELERKIAAAEASVKEERKHYLTVAEALLKEESTWDLEQAGLHLGEEEKGKISEAVLFYLPDTEGDHPYISELKKISSDKKKVAAEEHADFKAVVDEFRAAVQPMRDFVSPLKDKAEENRALATSFLTAGARREALLASAKRVEDEAKKQDILAQAEEVNIKEPPYDKLTEIFYASIPQYHELSPAFLAASEAAMAKVPEKVSTDSARENLGMAKSEFKDLKKIGKKNDKRVDNWRHDRPVSMIGAFFSFLTGKDWVTNSSWHDSYGLLPLFTGSLLISLIALIVAIPFAVGAAVYVNQVAPFKEQSFIKPTIEFIEAIPSIVLGFFGILVLGTALRELSQVPYLSWVPGFPMSERLNILTAGLLLAFMAVPTIFTLAEDALNNVPATFTENSLALGASKIQTVFRVVVPTAVSGIMAAVLLGFGRVIGETMVVLLVAGNKIQIPDFSKGIGVVTEPAHTMTGIIAQELGEVSQGTIHWQALFMVGMVLFAISLIINFSAQQVLRRFQKI